MHPSFNPPFSTFSTFRKGGAKTQKIWSTFSTFPTFSTFRKGGAKTQKIWSTFPKPKKFGQHFQNRFFGSTFS